MEAPEKFINIEKVLQEKASGLYKFLPRFAINWLKRKLHEDDINTAMPHLNKYHGLAHNDEVLKFFGVKVIVNNPERIPLDRSIIVASNHPLGGLDGMALIKSVGDLRPDVRFFVNDILRNLKNFGDVFVGVNKVGTTSREALVNVEQVYASNAAILVFPAGLVSRKQPQGIMDLEWNKSFISKAVKYNKPVVPVFIEGKNSKFFYNLARWRKRLGIKGNIEMMFLPDEMFKQKGNTIVIHVGEPIEPSYFTKDKTHQQWAEEMKMKVYGMVKG